MCRRARPQRWQTEAELFRGCSVVKTGRTTLKDSADDHYQDSHGACRHLPARRLHHLSICVSRGFKGSGIGGAGGGVVGAVTGGDVLAGAAIGATAGTVIGIATEDRNRCEDRGGQRHYYGNSGRQYKNDKRRRKQYQPR
jgi:hypothetical protein